MQHTFTRKEIYNITTGILHTPMDDIYNFFDRVIGLGVMTHMLPNAAEAIKPILIEKLPLIKTEGYYPDELGSVIFIFDDEDKNRFWKSYGNMESALNKLSSKI